MERRLPDEFRALVEQVLADLTRANHDDAMAVVARVRPGARLRPRQDTQRGAGAQGSRQPLGGLPASARRHHRGLTPAQAGGSAGLGA